MAFGGLLVSINEVYPKVFKDTDTRKGTCPQALFTLITWTQFTPTYLSTKQFSCCCLVNLGLPSVNLMLVNT